MQVLPGPLVAAPDDEVLAAPAAGLAPSRRVLRRFLRKPSAVVAAAFVLVVAIGCTFASWLAPYGANDRVPGGAHQPPGAHYLLGTDGTGRDILSRLMFGGQVSLRVIVAVVALALAVAVPVGVLAGFKGGRIDLVIMRLVEAGSAVPPLILALCVAGVLGPGVNNVIFALALVMVPGLVRLARGSALAVAAEPFIEASKAIGTPTRRIAVHRVFPNVRSVIIVQVAFLLSGALLAEAGLSYLGIGAQPPTPTWGNMLRQAYDTSLFTDAWQVIAPAIVLVATVFAFNTIADGLRDAFGLAAAPKRRHRVQGGGLGLTAVSRSAAPPAATDEQGDDVLRVSELSVVFDGDDGPTKVVDNVSFTVRNGEILGLVGESGCGKSVTSLALMRLLASPPAEIVAGSVVLNGRDVLGLGFAEMRRVRGPQMSMVFQDSLTALAPAFTIGNQLVESIRAHQPISRRAARARAVELLEYVGIPAARRRLDDYPHQLSGGTRQRVMIAAALSCEPRVLIADEPTTALDVTVQAQILDLLRRLRSDLGMAVIFITHDLGVVAEICDRAAVMYAGQIVEEASIEELFARPQHPYTRGLLESMPQVGATADRLKVIPGNVPLPSAWPKGCRFRPRCGLASSECETVPIELTPTASGQARCLLAQRVELTAKVKAGQA